MVRNRDTRDRRSKGIILPPLIPVDGVESLGNGSATVATLRTIDATPRRSARPPTSLELVRNSRRTFENYSKSIRKNVDGLLYATGSEWPSFGEFVTGRGWCVGSMNARGNCEERKRA